MQNRPLTGMSFTGRPLIIEGNNAVPIETFITGEGKIKCGNCNITISGDQTLIHKPGCRGTLLVRPNNLPADLETRMVDGVAVTTKIQ